MDIKFPDREESFRKTLIKCVVSCLAALAIGLFLGNGLGALFGTDESVLITSTYTDRMSAIRTVFTDGDQLDSFSRTALTLRDMEGLRLLSGRNRNVVLARQEGETVWTDAFSLFDDDIIRSLLELMNTEDVLYGVTDSTGKAIEDVWLRNIAVRDGVVYYYLYYDEAGFAGVAYDPGGEKLYGAEGTLPLTVTENGVYEWFITYDMGDT